MKVLWCICIYGATYVSAKHQDPRGGTHGIVRTDETVIERYFMDHRLKLISGDILLGVELRRPGDKCGHPGNALGLKSSDSVAILASKEVK